MSSRVLTRNDVSAGQAASCIMVGGQWTDHAPTMHAELIAALESSEFSVHPEYHTGWLGDERNGRLDIVCRRDGGVVGIELDARKPRRRSILKLGLFQGFRIIGLRGVMGLACDGIDAVICMPVTQATQRQKRDRRIYRPRPRTVPVWANDWKGEA